MNVVTSKTISKTPLELWNGNKPSLHHFRIWGCLTHVLRPKPGKLESTLEVCIFVGYAPETRGGYFYSPKDQKGICFNNWTFLEHDYMNNYKPQSNVVLEDLTVDKIPS